MAEPQCKVVVALPSPFPTKSPTRRRSSRSALARGVLAQLQEAVGVEVRRPSSSALPQPPSMPSRAAAVAREVAAPEGTQQPRMSLALLGQREPTAAPVAAAGLAPVALQGRLRVALCQPLAATRSVAPVAPAVIMAKPQTLAARVGLPGGTAALEIPDLAGVVEEVTTAAGVVGVLLMATPAVAAVAARATRSLASARSRGSQWGLR